MGEETRSRMRVWSAKEYERLVGRSKSWYRLLIRTKATASNRTVEVSGECPNRSPFRMLKSARVVIWQLGSTEFNVLLLGNNDSKIRSLPLGGINGAKN